MPKIIENLRERLKEEARKQIEETTYGEVTIRSVAKACGVATGTVYNYFPSKNALIASYMLDDWKQCITAIENTSMTDKTVEATCKCIYEQLVYFGQKHAVLFHDESALPEFQNTAWQYHSRLRSQLAKPLETVCPNEFTAEFVAESLLTWTVSGKSFQEIWSIIEKIFS